MLAFSFTIPRLFNRKKNVINRAFDKINKLKSQLVSLGYHPNEIDYIIYNTAGNSNLSNPDARTIEKIERTLEEKYRIAQKSIKMVKSELIND